MASPDAYAVDAVIECPRCTAEIYVVFQASEDVFEQQDLTDAPTTTVACGECGHVFEAEYPGWTTYEDAG